MKKNLHSFTDNATRGDGNVKRRIRWIPLLFVLILAAALRLVDLGSVPTGPNWDEAALGYNAYSVLKTGKDEYGTFLPLALRSYDDYKPPLYMYMAIPSVAAFGLNLWSVRLPAVVSGILAVFGTFFLARELFTDSEKFRYAESLPYLTSLLLAISPWHLQFTRTAFEAGVGVTINIWAITTFLWGRKNGKFFLLSAFLFGLGFYAYHSERIFLPLIGLVLVVVYWKSIREQGKTILISCVIGFLTVAPLVPVVTNPTTLARLRGTSALADQTRLLQGSVSKLTRDQKSGDKLGLLFDNRRIVYAQTLIEGYLSHFSLRWLFLTGDNARHHAPGMGLLYLLELPFFLLGIYSLTTSRGKTRKMLLGWVLVAPVAASPTTELPHAIRTLVFLPSLQVLTAAGLWSAYTSIRQHPLWIRSAGYLLFASAVIFNVGYYLDMYFVQQDIEYSQFWQYGYREAVAYSVAHYGTYKKIVVSTKLEQPHMFFLFYLRYDPMKYLREGGTASGGFAEVKNRFDKYEFRPIHWDKENHDGATLYIGTPGEILGTPFLTINYLNGQPAMKIAR